MGPVRYSISEELQFAFWKLNFTSNLPRALAVIAAIVVILGILVFVFEDWVAALTAMICIMLGGTATLLCIRFILFPRQAKKAWADYALIKEHVDLTLDEAGFSLVQPSAHVDAKWTQIVRWNEQDELFAMYLNSQLAYILPKDQVGKEIIDFARERLIKSGLVTKGKRRK